MRMYFDSKSDMNEALTKFEKNDNSLLVIADNKTGEEFYYDNANDYFPEIDSKFWPEYKTYLVYLGEY